MNTDWTSDLGVSGWKPPNLFVDPVELIAGGRAVPQAHALRRAFEEMKLDGVLCMGRMPVVYFREVQKIDSEEVRELHRKFWSQGLAPALVLITPANVHVYSGLTLPARQGEDVDGDHRLVTTLSRVTQVAELRQLVLSMQSGEFFRVHAKSFNPARRVDRELLRNLKTAREEMQRVSDKELDSRTLDAVICRVIFASYLFDRKVIGRTYLESIGIPECDNLREVLARLDRRDALYRLFEQLGRDFNGDLFQDDLLVEKEAITRDHLNILQRLLQGSDVRSGQGRFWPYDFSIIPIETISAIYEHFLNASAPDAKKDAGAFYTPRFLAEIILDLALEDFKTLLDKRFLDPACGSGIFLVGLFNRIAEEWKYRNPTARYDGRASALMAVLRNSLFGVDLNPTACRITAFSLYLAFLDQLSPPDIRKLQGKGKMLPRLVYSPGSSGDSGKTIFCQDFFATDDLIGAEFDAVVGNPPWTSGKEDARFVKWCSKRKLELPDRQSAIAFAWKAPMHLANGGICCLVLPHGVLFNHGPTSLRFQRDWLSAHAVEMVLNLADFQRFLFEEAENPAVVISYRREPADLSETIRYLTPKMDWNVAQAELLTIHPQDLSRIEQRTLIAQLKKGRMPVEWKERFWGTPRDWKFLDRLRAFSPLDAITGHGDTRWTIGQGIQEPGASDDPADSKEVVLPTRNLVEARRGLALFLLERDCLELPSKKLSVREKSNTNTEIFKGPHVFITDGFKVAFAEFDAVCRQSVRAIKGKASDARLLVFLAAYLNSPLASYYLFHTAANVGIERAKAESGDVLRLPFPLPDEAPSRHAEELVDQANEIYRLAIKEASAPMGDRAEIVRVARARLTKIVYEYFDVDENERLLIEDTNQVFMKSVRRRRASEAVPTLRGSTSRDREAYAAVVRNALNEWAQGGKYEVQSAMETSLQGGVGVVVFTKVKRGERAIALSGGYLPVMDRLQRVFKTDLGTVEFLRGIKVFDRERLFVLKPLSLRFWTKSAALNDADDIAAAILSRPARATV